MKIGEFRELIKDMPDDAEIIFEDPNFGGAGDDMSKHDIKVVADLVLISPPYWTPVD